MRGLIQKLMLAASGLTFTACYGVPYSTYEIKGRVVDTEGNTIQGIAVSLDRYDCLFDGEDAARLVADGWQPDAWSNADGNFLIHRNSYGTTLSLCLHDVDGAENGGEFAAQHVEVSFERTKEGNLWREELYTAPDIEVVMRRVENNVD